MRKTSAWLLVGVTGIAFAGARPASAAFELSGPGASPFPAAAPAAPIVLRPPEPAESPPRQSGPPVAMGFGHHVPLRFATRQIVPKTVRVSFGPDLDAEATAVEWAGGRPWPDVLRSALRPTGLRATFRPGAVHIGRGPGW